MSESSSEGVECPICGEAFDPTAAGGWCTNPDCGEWQYLGDEVPDPAESESAGEGDAAATAEETPDDNGDAPASTSATGDATASPEAEAGPADGSAAPADTGARQLEDADDGGEAAVDADQAVPADAEQPSGDDAVGAVAGTAGGDAAEGAVATACPDCGSSVDPADNFCASCGADLRAGETLETCPGCDADVDDGDSFCPNCGEDLEAARATLGDEAAVGDDAVGDAAVSAADEAPAALELRARGETVEISDDQTLGREVRRIVTDTGGDEDEAVRIHREHVRFVREGDGFYLVDLGDNPTRLNDTALSKGDREPVEPGDQLELSGVVTLAIETP